MWLITWDIWEHFCIVHIKITCLLFRNPDRHLTCCINVKSLVKSLKYSREVVSPWRPRTNNFYLSSFRWQCGGFLFKKMPPIPHHTHTPSPIHMPNTSPSSASETTRRQPQHGASALIPSLLTFLQITFPWNNSVCLFTDNIDSTWALAGVLVLIVKIL